MTSSGFADLHMSVVAATPPANPQCAHHMQRVNDPSRNRGQGLILVDADSTTVDPSCYYLAEMDGKAQLVSGQAIETKVLGRVLLVVMPPRPAGQTPKAID